MPTVTDLESLWGTSSGGSGVIGGSVTANQFNLRVGSKPGRDGCGSAVGQHVNEAVSFQVHNERPIRAATPKSKVIKTIKEEGFWDGHIHNSKTHEK